jgi:hypothetical protein
VRQPAQARRQAVQEGEEAQAQLEAPPQQALGLEQELPQEQAPSHSNSWEQEPNSLEPA